MPRLLINLFLVLLVWSIWLFILGPESAKAIVLEHIEIAITMLFGSFVAGSTSFGGGAVAFPVFTKVLNIPSSITIVFSLAIQSIGMGAASILIATTGTRFNKRIVLISSLFGVGGIIVGLFALKIPSNDVRYVFSMFSVIAALALIVDKINSVKSERSGQTINSVDIHWGLIAITAFIGGILSGLIGTGIDFVIFTIMIFLGFFGIREAIATSVVIMAINAIIGFTLILLFTDRFSGEVVEYWQAAVPIVVVGAPLGALACRYLPRDFMFYFLLLLIAIDVISTILILGFRWQYFAVLALVLGLIFIFKRSNQTAELNHF